jgi:DNA-binding NtrC family response regulator
MPANARIMVVEDDANSRSALAELLRLWGYQPETACDGTEALHKLTATHPTIIISDLQMPGLSGVELIKALRRSAPQVRCIVVTGTDSAEKAALLNGLDIVDCLEKPLDPRRLRQGLQRCIEAGKRSVDNPS